MRHHNNPDNFIVKQELHEPTFATQAHVAPVQDESLAAGVVQTFLEDRAAVHRKCKGVVAGVPALIRITV